ncbi:hypothetical protein [Mycolicibacterium bacteremicum]|uniref:Uncharacterized protein n=1 Tax=Mycolicibacterium bacteremicum TaxID=564198 RepID=A0A1W9YP82_MYCBA|nr:hypothetical protein [Mycolicibacterium bacteremicum]MCV7435566.1 hypothetical protein [Mycolicibacterium bacteremicum]ORA01853.1 hypothetical protein BST17_26305 [Mycolicibacterium bacteremicum]
MSAVSKLEARHRAREAQRKMNELRAQRQRANAEDATAVRAVIGRLHDVDEWEGRRLAQTRQQVTAEAQSRRRRYFAEAGASIRYMRDRGETLASIAELVGVDVSEIRAVLHSKGTKGPVAAQPGARGTARTDMEWPRCVRCDALMMDPEDRPRRGRRRLYCSDSCRRDASAARMAAERHGAPIRVIEVPRAGSFAEPEALRADPPAPVSVTALDAADIASRDEQALCLLLARLTERARRKDLDRATLTAARDLAKAVYPYRS